MMLLIFIVSAIVTLFLCWYTSQPKCIGKWWSDSLWWLGVIISGVSLFKVFYAG